MFIDEVQLTFKAGKGGDGIVSWRREKYIPKGGPYGGDGGDGGNIILRATTHETTLGKFRHQKIIKAEDGEKGGTQEMHGATARDTIIEVPVGTLITDIEDGEVINDLTEPGQEFLICEGGRGGFGNAHFPSSTRQAPNFAELGDIGEEKHVKLELKLVADVGLVGLPNAGKSTVIQSITNVKPKIADYAFTTITPNLGVMEWKGHSLVIEDVPGLIEGASEGKGLGFQFLKHIDRCRIIIHLLDASQGEEAMIENYHTVRKELEKWWKKKDENSEMEIRGNYPLSKGDLTEGQGDLASEKVLEQNPSASCLGISPSKGSIPEELIVLSKADIIDPDQLEEMKKIFEKTTQKKVALTISAGAYIRIDELKDLLISKLEIRNSKFDETDESRVTSHESRFYDLKRKSDPKHYTLARREDGDFDVTGERIEEIVRMTDTRYIDGINRVYDVMEKMSIMRKIKLIVKDELLSGKGGFFEGEDEIPMPSVWISGKKFSLENVIFMREGRE